MTQLRQLLVDFDDDDDDDDERQQQQQEEKGGRRPLGPLIGIVSETVEGTIGQTDQGSDYGRRPGDGGGGGKREPIHPQYQQQPRHSQPSTTTTANPYYSYFYNDNKNTMVDDSISAANLLAQVPPPLAEGLANVDRTRLSNFVQPIWNALETLDAQSLLSLQQTPQGAELRNG